VAGEKYQSFCPLRTAVSCENLILGWEVIEKYLEAFLELGLISHNVFVAGGGYCLLNA